MPNKLPSSEYLIEIFMYDDGVLTWKHRPIEHFKSQRAHKIWNLKYALKVAGRKMPTSDYRQVMVDGVRYLEHRIIAAMFGIDTSNLIDHIDGNGLNNKIDNLRPATHQQNMWNNSGWKKKLSRIGIYQKPNGRWTAYIRELGRQKNLGTFATEEEAINARASAEARVYGRFSREAKNAEQNLCA